MDGEYLHPYLTFFFFPRWMSTSLASQRIAYARFDINGIWISCLGHKLQVKKNVVIITIATLKKKGAVLERIELQNQQAGKIDS